MATKETVKARSVIAGQLSSAFRDRSFSLNLARFTPLDEDGDLVIIPAHADESAAVLLHRLDRMDGSQFSVATILDNDLHVRSFRRVPLTASPSSVLGETTVGDLFRRILAAKDSVFVVDGLEFKAALSEGASVSTLEGWR